MEIRFVASFPPGKSSLRFDVQEGSATMMLVADGKQMAEIAKLLLLKGKGKSFQVVISDLQGDNKNGKSRSRAKTFSG